jgi:hypothetical protein
VFQQAFPTDERGRPTGKGDSGLIRYYLGCREGWREREKRIKIEGNVNQTPIVQYVIKEEIDADKEKERVKSKK